MADYNLPHSMILENKEKLSVSGVLDVDTFDENKIVLFITDDTMIIDGCDLHIQKLDVTSGELVIDGEVYSVSYTGTPNGGKGSKGLFGKIFK